MTAPSLTFRRSLLLVVSIVLSAASFYANRRGRKSSCRWPGGKSIVMVAGAATPYAGPMATLPVWARHRQCLPWAGAPGAAADDRANRTGRQSPGGPPGKPGEAAKPGEPPKPIQRPAKPETPPDPKELKVGPDKKGKFKFTFNGQPWLGGAAMVGRSLQHESRLAGGSRRLSQS